MLRQIWWLGLVGMMEFYPNRAIAQVVPDSTLGSENSIVAPLTAEGLTGQAITGGATRGTILFHSFDQFSVPAGSFVRFDINTSIQNVISRVTGQQSSTISGIVTALSPINLYLINPKGIEFNPGANIAINGSFLATTANTFTFGNGLEFSATNPQAAPLLTVNVTPGLQMGNNPGAITNRAILRVSPGNFLGLVGGDVSLEQGQLYAPGGRIELGGLSSPGEIGLTFVNNILLLKFPEKIARSNIRLTDNSRAEVIASNGGSIKVTGRNIDLIDSALVAGIPPNLGSATSQAGDIEIDASDALTINGSITPANQNTIAAGIANGQQGGAGSSGNIIINTGSFTVLGNSLIGSVTNGQGDSGSVLITATDAVLIDTTGTLFRGIASIVGNLAIGDGANIQINAPSITLKGAIISTGTIGRGNSGSIQLESPGAISITDSTLFAASTTSADAGNIIVESSQNSISLERSQVNVENNAGGFSGEIRLSARDKIVITDQANFGLPALSSRGQGGRIQIGKSDTTSAISPQSITIKNASVDVNNENVTNLPQTAINVGGISLHAIRDILLENSRITSFTDRLGNAGDITLQSEAGTISFTQASNLFGTVEAGGIGNAGKISIVAQNLALRDGSQLQSIVRGSDTSGKSPGQGNAGEIDINVGTGQLLLTGSVPENGNSTTFYSSVLSEVGSGAIGNGGNITIKAGSILAEDSTSISTTISSGTEASPSKAGNLSINLTDKLSLNSSSIRSDIASSGVGVGGDISVAVPTLQLTRGAQITTSVAGQGSAGSLTINATAVDIDGENSAGTPTPSGLQAQIEFGGRGKAGNLSLFTQRLRVSNGGKVQVATFGNGDGGNLVIQADEIDVFDSPGANPIFLTNINSGVSFDAFRNRDEFGNPVLAEGNAGQLRIDTRRLSIRNGGLVTSDSLGKGDGGTVRINADLIEVIGNRSRLAGSVGSDVVETLGTQAIGTGGDLIINANRLDVRDGGQVSVTNRSSGAAGTLSITGQIINLSNEGVLSAETSSGQGGNISIRANDYLLLRRGSRVSATSGTSQSGGDGGNIFITSPFVVTAPFENSDISANAFSGRGGSVRINAQTYWISPISRTELEQRLGTTNPNQLNSINLVTNDVTAISQVNPDLSGQIILSSPDLDPSRGLASLPSGLADPTNQISQACSPQAQATNSFSNVGRGGIAAMSGERLGDEVSKGQWVTVDGSSAQATQVAKSPKPIVEAQTWRRDTNGDILLMAQSSTPPYFPSKNCPP